MQKELQAEVIHCPNCHENVPKTLYCLNCGYPLYKVEQQQDEAEKEDTSTVDEVSEQIEIELTTTAETELDVPTIAEEVEVPTIAEEVEAPMESIDEVPVVEEDLSAETDVTASDETLSVITEEAIPETVEYAEEAEEVVAAEEVQEEIAVEEIMEEDQEVTTDFEPDLLVKAVMARMAKNISLRVRLVNLLVNDGVNETTFNRLFDSYSAKGERWITRRNDMLERDRYDLEMMNKDLLEAKMNLEELEIRRAIRDVSVEEYEAKAYAFKWDKDHLERKIQATRGEIAYLGDLTRVTSAEEISDLKEMAENCSESMNVLVENDKIGEETATRIKTTLKEALECLD